MFKSIKYCCLLYHIAVFLNQDFSYVKEFVHGDFGRTVPSLGTLLDTSADILELDVEVMLFIYNMYLGFISNVYCIFYYKKKKITLFLKNSNV